MKHLKKHIIIIFLIFPVFLLAQSLKNYFDEFDNHCRNVRGYAGALKAEIERENAIIPDVAKKYVEKVGKCLADVRESYAKLKKSLNQKQLEMVGGNIKYLDEYCKRADLHYRNLTDELKKPDPKPERVREFAIAIYNELRKASQEVKLMKERLGVK
ncbi:hypothetical protein [Candidatus Kryptobacter tengchongensis]|uniref:Uncharacterized protein n=1 Tax=Kryptobacter tengchongensis TaxID=1643429 RepID=A0A656D3W9_KRYT1|nr:hypothetical protein [Candidatus Kryptobacter tengchongensis]CUS97346.1 hypothetical protein JGI24_00259 [Candidatus Kryptobacter tengchongensis]